MRRMTVLLLLLPTLLIAQNGDKKPDVWEPLRFFVGHWVGTGTGQAGESMVERQYRFVLGENFLKAENKSTYKPQEKNPEGESHENWDLISYDQVRKKFVFRQFHVEGFVNQYVLDSISPDGKTIIFVTEAIENIPSGWKARESYQILSDSEFVERFELAAPGKEFELYGENRLKRKS